ncbi:Tctex1 domain-containing protein 1 [Lamellibrachia satsuma]|nr:Tctex1 domain-containing protein 1 [Lamellibrachia satsuma]
MTDALENHQGTVSIGGRTITNLRFADDIDGLAGDEQELVNLVERLEKTSSSYGMEISAEKTKLMTNSTQGISTEVKVNEQRLEAVTSFRYLGSIITDEGSKPEILARIAQTTAALIRLKPLWNDRNITVSSKIRLMRSLVMSIFLYACETWTLSADLQKKIQAMEMRCFRKILHISYKDHVTNDAVRNKIKQAIGPYDDLLTTVKKRKLKWYGHVSRSSGLAKTILQGTVRGGRRRGRQKKRWEDNIKEWTGMEFADSQRAVENRKTWRELVRKSSMVPQRSLRVMGNQLFSGHSQRHFSPNRRAKVVRRPPAAMSDRISVEGSDTRSMHRPTATDATGGGGGGGGHIPPMIGQPHRRMSRADGPPGLGSQRHAYRRTSIASSFRTDQSSQLPHQSQKLANTYRLAPREDEGFSVHRVQKVINSVLRSFLDGEEYEAKRSRQMAQNIADVIRTRVKEMQFPRYRIVTNVVITPGSGQSMQFNSRCLWDVSTDSFASATYKNTSLYAVVTVHAVYFE